MTAIDHKALHNALAKVADERIEQHRVWGVQRHSWPEWISILTEEVGEAARGANKVRWFNWDKNLDRLNRQIDERRDLMIHLRDEMIQTAAVAVAILEHLDEALAAIPEGSAEVSEAES